ncbi:MAG: hypothetical protein PHC50_06565 [Candidatus Cloacimonetes bacterium]|nr:hypothetical protein [Candidatus Cloacimonadota bacterium]
MVIIKSGNGVSQELAPCFCSPICQCIALIVCGEQGNTPKEK